MAFFGEKQRKYVRTEHKTQYWDEGLYSAIFKRKESEWEKVNGHMFCCELTRRESTIKSHCRRSEHVYYGRVEVGLDVYGSYSAFLVSVEFEPPSEWLILNSDENEIGCMSFGSGVLPSGEEAPSINIILVDKYDLTEKISRFFVEAKTTGTKGIEVHWAAILTSVIGSSAEFLKSAVGRRFPLQSCEFKLNIE